MTKRPGPLRRDLPVMPTCHRHKWAIVCPLRDKLDPTNMMPIATAATRREADAMVRAFDAECEGEHKHRIVQIHEDY